MSIPPIRVFLYSNCPKLLPLLSHLESQLQAHHPLPFDPVLVARESILAGERPAAAGRDMQEGDFLITIGVPDINGDTLRKVHDRALVRKLVVFPFVLASNPAEPGPETKLIIDKRFDGSVLKASKGISALADEMLTVIQERAILGSTETDLLARWLPEKPSKDPLCKDSLELLETASAQSSGYLQESAHETRVQAAIAIRARLYQLALETLERAIEFDSTSAISAYWMARLKVAQNFAHSLIEALGDATRAARLAQLQGSHSPLEIASWRLAARISSMMGDLTGMQEYLHSAELAEPRQRDLQIENIRLFKRMGVEHKGVELIEAIYERDHSVLEAISNDPELRCYHSHLTAIHERREESLCAVWVDVEACEKLIREARGKKFAPLHVRVGEHEGDLIEFLEARTTKSLEDQLRLLNHWGSDLIGATRAVYQIRSRRHALETASREMPPRADYDFILERVWPRLRKRFSALQNALAQTDQLQAELKQSEEDTIAQLRVETGSFMRCAEAFEKLLVKHTNLLPEPDTRKHSVLQGLRVLQRDTKDLPRLGTLLPEDLCEILEFPTMPTTPPLALYRIERDSHGCEGASRVGVYFNEAKSKFG